MSRRPWYKRYGGDFVLGTMSLSLEEKGAYSIILDLIYDQGQPIHDDARWLAGVCGVSVRKWNAIRERLIEAGKITVVDGRITNKRASKMLQEANAEAEKHAENGAKGGRKQAENAANREDKSAEIEQEANENNAPVQAGLKPIPEARSQSISLEDKSSKASPVSDPNKLAWQYVVEVMAEAGSSEDDAKKFFGKLLRDHKLAPRDLMPAIAQAQANATRDPKSYLTAAARRISAGFPAQPAKRVGFV